MSKYITIEQDLDPDSPRNWDNLGTMACFLSRYNLGDKDHGVYLEDRYDEHDKRWVKVLMIDEKEVTDDDYYISLPLYLYDHSGITMNTTGFSCPWDSGQVGLIFVSKEKVRKEYGWKLITKARREKILDYLRGEVKVYDQFLTGDIYGFRCYVDGEETDSCWGFYGSDPVTNGMIEHIGKDFYAEATVIREYAGEKLPEDAD